MTKDELIEPDKKQCQAEKPNGNTFMTLGGVPALIRCEKNPVIIATESEPDKNGLQGSMSMCDKCWKVAIEQLGENYFRVQPIQ